jgi:hypothetical protein
MTTTLNTFFASEQNAAVVRSFATTLRTIPPLEPPHPEVVKPLTQFFSILAQNLTAFDEHCPANIEWLGKRFVEQLDSFGQESLREQHERLIDIFTTAYRFLCELEFSQPGELSFELREIQNFVHDNLEQFHGTSKQQLIFASYTMPARLTKRILQHSSLSDFKAFADTANAAKKMKADWDTEILAKKVETDGLQDAINRLQTKYNFVGLVKGFEVLVNKKKTEADRAFKALLALGGVMVLPVCIQLGFVLNNIEAIDSHRATLVYSLPPLLALELILLYFFRVVLANFRGIQAQLLQLDLRVSLCQFIQSYSEYSSKIKKVDSTALERFEAIVFSAVTSDAERMPATFDGLEQLAKLVSSLRSK